MTRSSRISKKQHQHLLACFISDTTATQAVRIAKQKGEKSVSRMCATRYFRHFRELIQASLLHEYPRFSGEVEIDIGFFGGRAAKWTSAQVREMAKLPRGRIVAQRKKIRKQEAKKQPVLGILNRGGKIFLLPIKSRSAAPMRGAVRMIVEKGAVIYSDSEKGLGDLKFDGYVHHQINKERDGHVSPEGYHANGIESFWREARRGMSKNFRGIPRSTLDMHIKEREWRYNTPDMGVALKALLRPTPSADRRPQRQRRTYKKSPRPPSPSRRTRRTGSGRASPRP